MHSVYGAKISFSDTKSTTAASTIPAGERRVFGLKFKINGEFDEIISDLDVARSQVKAWLAVWMNVHMHRIVELKLTQGTHA